MQWGQNKRTTQHRQHQVAAKGKREEGYIYIYIYIYVYVEGRSTPGQIDITRTRLEWMFCDNYAAEETTVFLSNVLCKTVPEQPFLRGGPRRAICKTINPPENNKPPCPEAGSAFQDLRQAARTPQSEHLYGLTYIYIYIKRDRERERESTEISTWNINYQINYWIRLLWVLVGGSNYWNINLLRSRVQELGRLSEQ